MKRWICGRRHLGGLASVWGDGALPVQCFQAPTTSPPAKAWGDARDLFGRTIDGWDNLPERILRRGVMGAMVSASPNRD